MQTVATLGAFRVKSDEDEEKLTIKHSISASSSESNIMEMEMHSKVLDAEMVNDPLWAA